MKIVNLLGESGLQIKRIGETIKNEAKEQKQVSPNVIRNISC